MELNKKEKAMIVLASATGVGTRKANKILELVGGAEYLSENIIKNKTDITKLISEKDYQQLCFNLENLNFKKLEQTLEETKQSMEKSTEEFEAKVQKKKLKHQRRQLNQMQRRSTN